MDSSEQRTRSKQMKAEIDSMFLKVTYTRDGKFYKPVVIVDGVVRNALNSEEMPYVYGFDCETDAVDAWSDDRAELARILWNIRGAK
jgi:hypothetical protein